MTDETDIQDPVDTPPEPAPAPEPAPPIESRFLFVDVAALRAKQLRRGALPRLAEYRDAAGELRTDLVRKPERVAMEEVRRGLIGYDWPEPPQPAPPAGEQS